MEDNYEESLKEHFIRKIDRLALFAAECTEQRVRFLTNLDIVMGLPAVLL